MISQNELDLLTSKYNAKSNLHYDILLDRKSSTNIYYKLNNLDIYMGEFDLVINKEYGKSIIGKYPVNDNDVFLYLPISKQLEFGKNFRNFKSNLE